MSKWAGKKRSRDMKCAFQSLKTVQNKVWKRVELLFVQSPLNWLTNAAGVAAIESLAVCGRLFYFVSAKDPRNVGRLYSFNLAGGPVDVLLNNETNSCSEIKRVASFKNILALTDSGAYQVEVYDPVDKVIPF